MRSINKLSLIAFTLFSLTLFDFCTSNEPISTVKIEGHISNFESYYNEYVAVKIYINDFASGEQISYSSMIDENGLYKIEFEKYHPQDIYLKYGNRLITIFVTPGDKIIANINATEFINRENDNAIFFSGDGKKTNENIYFYRDFYYDNIPQQYRGDPDDHARKLIVAKYKEYIYDRKKVHTSYLNKFITQNDVSETFKLWMKYQIEYECAEALLDYYQQQRKVRNRNQEPNASMYDVEPSYYTFLSEYKLDDPSANICSAYHSYLSGYDFYHYQKLAQKFGTEDEGLLYRERFKQIIEMCHGFCKEVLLTQLFSHVLEEDSGSLNENYQLYLANVSTDYLRNHVINKYQLVQGNAIETKMPETVFLTDLTDIDEIDNILEIISDKHKNKVIYIDCWAVWCNPCLQEMPFSMKLQEYFQDQDVSFVYLCMLSSKPIWKDTISKMGLSGDHYFLDNKQSEIIKPLLGVVGYPHYVLVGKNGEVIKKGAQRPSGSKPNQLNQDLINQISELIKG